MHRIDTTNKAVDLFGAGKHGWRDGNKALGINATEFNAAMMNMLQEELVGIVEAASIALDPNNRAQLLTALRSAGVFTTPAQFDVSTKAATMQALQRAIGNNQKFLSYGTNTTLTSADVGALIQVNDVSTTTLPLESTCPNGTRFEIYAAANGVVISRQGTNSILTPGFSALTSLTLNVGDSVVLESYSGIGNWYIVGGSVLLRYSTDFGASLAAQGYQKLPSGLIIQWGEINTSASADVTFTYPISFPNAVYSISGSCYNGAGAQNIVIGFGNKGASLSSITVGAFVGNTAARQVQVASIIVVGK